MARIWAVAGRHAADVKPSVKTTGVVLGAALFPLLCTVSPIDGTGGWDAFPTRAATHFHADAHGRHVTRP